MDDVNVKSLCRDVVHQFNLPILDCWFWHDRRYERNDDDSHAFDLQIMMWSYFCVAFGFTWLVYQYFPSMIMSSIFFLGVNFGLAVMFISYANKGSTYGVLLLVLSLLAYYGHWNLHLTVFKHHVEPCLFLSYASVACLVLLRRYWNVFAWWNLDRITLKYYRDHNLALEETHTPIEDFREAYYQTLERLNILLMLNSKGQILSLTDLTLEALDSQFDRETDEGLAQAMKVLDEMIKTVNK